MPTTLGKRLKRLEQQAAACGSFVAEAEADRKLRGITLDAVHPYPEARALAEAALAGFRLGDNEAALTALFNALDEENHGEARQAIFAAWRTCTEGQEE
jgi:hypothetical protein